MKHSDHHQASLFTPTTTIVETAANPSTQHPDQTPNDSDASSLNIEITREELANQIIEGMVQDHRWEKERALGATDEELATAFGVCWVHSHTLDVHFDIDPVPTARCTNHTGQELLTLDAAEIASLVRTFAEIPQAPNPDERDRLLNQQLQRERLAARNEMFSAVQGILGDKARKKEQGFTQQFINLLFTENCLEEKNEGQTLEKITAMLIRRQWTTAKAMKAALQMVERAHFTWRSVEGYWLNRKYY